jgi:hypothetical protein
MGWIHIDVYVVTLCYVSISESRGFPAGNGEMPFLRYMSKASMGRDSVSHRLQKGVFRFMADGLKVLANLKRSIYSSVKSLFIRSLNIRIRNQRSYACVKQG